MNINRLYTKHKTYIWIASGVLGVLVLVTALILWVPPVNTRARGLYKQGKELVFGKEPIEIKSTPIPVVSSSPTADVVIEKVVSLDEKAVAISETEQANKDTFDQMQGDLRAMVTQVTRAIDLLQKRQNEWLTALKKAGIVVSSSSIEDLAPKNSTSTSSGTSSGSTSTTETPSGKVNINTATLDQLNTLTGIGDTYAKRIIEYRTTNGKFKTIEDIQQVSGIGPSTFAKIKDSISV